MNNKKNITIVIKLLLFRLFWGCCRIILFGIFYIWVDCLAFVLTLFIFIGFDEV